MNSIILKTTTTLFMPIFLLFSVVLLLRGHNSPGGGFVGGLMAAAAVSLYALAFSPQAARRLLRVDPLALIGIGLLVAAASGTLALTGGRPYMTGMWTTLARFGADDIHVGTPLLFDAGVYLVVVGVVATVVLTLAEEE
jgi:multicomponent Na+:H+ antiporter subunit B